MNTLANEKLLKAIYRSALTQENSYNSTNDLLDFLEDRRKRQGTTIEQIPFEKIEKWFDDQDGNLRHVSGKFFSIEGLETRNLEDGMMSYQPIINQPEHGILGLVAKVVDGIAYFLVQYKIEPGNKDLVQISPTVQATKSNYMRAHQGNSVPYIDYFFESKLARTFFKELQTEQGSKFFKKQNYNIMVEITGEEELTLLPNYKWVTLGQIQHLLTYPNIINMDLRSVIACIPLSQQSKDMDREEVEEWFNDHKTHRKYQSKLVTLKKTYDHGWKRDAYKIYSEVQKDFEVDYLKVTIENREVHSWTQPIIADREKKLNGFLIKKENNDFYLLVQACEEAGSYSGVELGPTVHNLNVQKVGEVTYSHFFVNPEEKNVIYSQLLSEEGGRFYHAENRYMIVLTEQEIECDGHYRWLTLAQLKEFVSKGSCVNVEARTLISCIQYGGII